MATTTKLVHRQLLLAKAETTYGTDSSPTAATNSILVQNVSYSETGLRMAKRPALRGNSIAPLQDIYAGQLRDISFECEVKGSGVAGTVPEIDPLLQACGMSVTTVALTSNTYAPNSNSATQGSVSMYLYLDGSLMNGNIIVTNAVSTFSQVKVVGQVKTPQSVAYHEGQTVLDVVLAVGGLTEFAAGNRAKIVRVRGGKQSEIKVRLNDLVNKGDMKQNIPLQPGDVLVVPESRF